jgi:hypothetical protein
LASTVASVAVIGSERLSNFLDVGLLRLGLNSFCRGKHERLESRNHRRVNNQIKMRASAPGEICDEVITGSYRWIINLRTC